MKLVVKPGRKSEVQGQSSCCVSFQNLAIFLPAVNASPPVIPVKRMCGCMPMTSWSPGDVPWNVTPQFSASSRFKTALALAKYHSSEGQFPEFAFSTNKQLCGFFSCEPIRGVVVIWLNLIGHRLAGPVS